MAERPLELPPVYGRGTAMVTAEEYRKYADECVTCAREATVDAVRDEFLELANLWLTAAARMEARPGPYTSADALDGHKPPRSAGIE